MYQYHKFLFMSAILLSFFGLTGIARGAEDASKLAAQITCWQVVPEGVEQNGSAVLSSGAQTTFSCLVGRTVEGEPLSVLLLGKQTYGTVPPAASANTLTLTNETSVATLVFPAVYEVGKYTYTFSLINTATQEVVAREFSLEGTLKGSEHATIEAMSIKEKRALWGTPITLNLALDIPEGQTLESDPLVVHIAMQDKEGKECAVLVDNQVVTQVGGTDTLTLPQEGTCINMLSVTLKDKDNAVLDQESLAVGMAEKTKDVIPQGDSLLTRVPPLLMTGMVVTGVLVLSLLGYFLIRRHRGY